MKKIMFNDKYGLTQAVLEGRKTQTRRLTKLDKLGEYNISRVRTQPWGEATLQAFIKNDAAFKVGEVIAIAQKYSETSWDRTIYDKLLKMCDGLLPQYTLAGWDNKMFVKADLMPHHIRIIKIRIERLQDISDEDCLAEGIWRADNVGLEGTTYWYHGLYNSSFRTPQEAYASLIDRISGKGTWESNPYVFVYEFELIDTNDIKK